MLHCNIISDWPPSANGAWFVTCHVPLNQPVTRFRQKLYPERSRDFPIFRYWAFVLPGVRNSAVNHRRVCGEIYCCGH